MKTSSWLTIPDDSEFSLSNFPLSVFSSASTTGPRCCTRLGDSVIDLAVLEEAGLFDEIDGFSGSCNVFGRSTLNAFAEHPKAIWLAFRKRLIELFTNNHSPLAKNKALQEAAFHDASTVTLRLPVEVGDYTDFYSSREHATNVGIMFRGPDNALQPNWLHLPVGYHGRSSTIFPSGTPVRRPMGQLQKDANDPNQGSIHGACRLLDFELEMAAVVGGPPNTAGTPLTLEQAKDRLFGFMLMNDWSARDIQKWEYVPLGPFTAKNFATTVSPWIVMSAALEECSARATTSAGEQQTDPVPLEYLKDPEYSSFDIALQVAIQSKNQSTPTVVCTSNFKNMYWNSAQQLVHHAVTGCIMKAGDLLGSGTISGQTPDSYGSMLELSWKGSKEIKVGDEFRKFLQDGDAVIMTGVSTQPGFGKVGFGECSGTILPALTTSEEAAAATTTATSTSADRYKGFKLYTYWRSSCSWRVRIALAAKGISYTAIPIDIVKGEQKEESYLAKHPLGQVPLLECIDTTTGQTLYLSQSVAIFEFLDLAFPTKRTMMPLDSKPAALEMIEVVNAGTQPLQNVIYLMDLEKLSGGAIKKEDQAKQVNERGLKALEKLVERRRQSQKGGPYALGTFSPTIADAFLVPQLYNARRFGVEVENVCPILTEIESFCLAHPWFEESHPAKQVDAPTS